MDEEEHSEAAAADAHADEGEDHEHAEEGEAVNEEGIDYSRYNITAIAEALK